MVRWILSGSGFNFNEINSSVRILIQQRRYNLSTTEEYDEDLNLISLRLKPVAIRAVASEHTVQHLMLRIWIRI